MITSDLRPSTTTKRKRFLENDTVGNVGNQDKDGKGLLAPNLLISIMNNPLFNEIQRTSVSEHSLFH